MFKIKLPGNKKGSTMVIVSLMLVAIFGICALVTDVGVTMAEKSKFQGSIDAASLAAAQELPDKNKAKDAALELVTANGYKESDIDISIGNMTVEIKGKKNIEFLFARILGIDNASLNVSTIASKDTMGGPFDYVLFSGSKTNTLILNGSTQTVNGNSHTNYKFVANGSKLTIAGRCEAMSTITINGGNIDIQNRIPNADYIPMPDFSEMIKQQAQKDGQIYNGNKTMSGSFVNVDKPIYVDGDLTVNGSHFKGNGCVLVTGNIVFNGSNLNASTQDSVCFYSKNGNITINGSNAVFEGIVYAPKGNIRMNGSNQTINGRVIGDTVDFNGSHLSINGSSKDLGSVPFSGVRLIK